MASLKNGIAITPVNSHEYSATFQDSWCIGSVPHGGYVTACFMQVAKTHFASTLSKQNQPHTITVHLEFVRRTQVGPATFKVRDIKLGRQTSTIHIALVQNGREEVLGYFIHANMPLEAGPSFDTEWALEPPPAPARSAALAAGTDVNWAERSAMPFASFRKASQNVRFCFPRHGQPHRGSVVDEWIALKSGEKWTDVSLGFVVDMFPQMIETFRSEGDPYAVKSEGQAVVPDEGEVRKNGMAKYWYPTLLLNVDVKKALPEQGVDWLFLRTSAKRIQNGRFDIEVVVLDETGDIVALSHHVCMILPAERNLAQRSTRKEGSKL